MRLVAKSQQQRVHQPAEKIRGVLALAHRESLLAAAYHLVHELGNHGRTELLRAETRDT